MKRIKSQEALIHEWMYNKGNYDSPGAVFSRGNKLYSYGHHFILAWYLDGTYILNTNHYSRTTSKHQAWTRYSIPGNNVLKIPLGDFERLGLKGVIKGAYDEINYLLKKAATARTKKDEYLGAAVSLSYRVLSFIDLIKKSKEAKHYNIDMRKVRKELNLFNTLNSSSSKSSLLRDAKLKVEKERKRAKAAKAKRERQAKINIQRWISGENVKLPYKIGIRIRRNDEDLETSWGVRIPMREAKILFDLLKSGRDYKGHTVNGMYKVLSWNGALRIGCHQIGRKEINRFAKLEWNETI